MSADSRRSVVAITLSTLIAPLVLVCLALGEETSSSLQGSWMATIGPAQTASQTFRGTWSAQIVPGKPNAGHGSWGVFNENGQLVMEGTWSAQKADSGWRGTWTAKVLRGRSISGSWIANMSGSSGKTFEDMLKSALQ